MVNALRATSEDGHEVNSVEIPVPLVIRRLSDLCTMKSGESITAKHMDPFAKYPCYGGNGLRGYTSRKTHSGHNLLIGRQGALCGNVCYVEGDIFASEHAVVVSPKPSVNIRWLSYLLERMRLNQYSESSAQPGLSVSKLLLLEVLAPQSYEEQQRIATVLSDTDSLISALEKLIEKKRNIKQGVMQELLTGKRRLPGFSGEWTKLKFSNIVKLRTERVMPSASHGRAYCIELEHIESGTGELIGGSIMSEVVSMKSVFKRGDVLFAKLRSYLRKYWHAANDGFCSTEFWCLTPDSNRVHSDYLFQLVKTDQFVASASTAYGTHMPRADWKIVGELSLDVPTLDEQIAIGLVLSTMDSEISSMRRKVDKLKQIKSALMQTLLTGKIRLTS